MTIFQPAPDTAVLVGQYAIWDSDIAENVIHVHNDGAWDTAQLTALCNAYIAWETTTTAGVKPQLLRNNVTTLTQVTARDLTTETSGAVAVAPPGGPIAGADTNKALSSGLTICVKLTTGIPGRSFRGRLFWIGLTAAWLQTDPNFLLSSTAAGIVTAVNNLRLAITAANAAWHMVVLSRQHNNVTRDTAVSTPVTQVSMTDGAIDYQRRRAPFHARHH